MNKKLVGVILAFVLLALGIAVWRDNSSKQVLPDGTVLVLSGVQIERTNVYTHGTRLSKMLGRLVPSNGVSVAGIKLRRARSVVIPGYDGRESLWAELRLVPGSPGQNALVSPAFYRKHRWMISSDRDDYVFVKDFDGFKSYDDGLFAYIRTVSFPRDSRLLHFRLEERDSATNREWREVATFVVKNPKPAPIEPWKPDHALRFKLAGDLEVEVGELTVRHEPIHPTDIWENTAYLPTRITRHGQAVTNWGILEGKIQDASGNFDSMPIMKVMTNDWMVYRNFRPLDPIKLWKFQLRFGCDADYPETNLYSFIVPFPSSGPLHTNLGEFPCRLGIVGRATLSVELTNKPAGKRLTFVSAVDDNGNNLYEGSGSWSQHSFWRTLRLTKPTQVHASVAIHPEYEVEFTLQPGHERETARTDQKRLQSKPEH